MAEQKDEVDNECIHPQEDELIDEFIQLCFETTKRKINWKNSASKNGVVLDVTTDQCFRSFFKDKEPTSGLQIVRGITEVEGITPRIFHEWNDGFQDSHVVWEKEFEQTCTESKVIRYVDVDHTTAYTSYAPGYMISPRDFVYLRTRRYFQNFKVSDNEQYEEMAVSFYYDIDPKSSDWCPPRAKHVRASSIGGYVFCRKKKGKGPVRLLFVSRMDLAGWIPVWVVNLAIASKTNSVSELKENMKIVVDREQKKRRALRLKQEQDAMKKLESEQEKGGKESVEDIKEDVAVDQK